MNPAADRCAMQTVEDPVASAPFSRRLREATGDAHREAEHSPFVEALVDGRLALGDYTRFVAQLHAVYSVLEDAVAASEDTTAQPFLRPELARVPSLTADLEHLRGPEWRDAEPTLPATEAYCARMRDVCSTWGGGLVAHHYVRYMGDLSGGQILGRVVRRVYGFPDGHGTSAYEFAQIVSPKRFKDEYRALLDAAPWDVGERERIVVEANRAFSLNSEIFRELAAAAR